MWSSECQDLAFEFFFYLFKLSWLFYLFSDYLLSMRIEGQMISQSAICVFRDLTART